RECPCEPQVACLAMSLPSDEMHLKDPAADRRSCRPGSSLRDSAAARPPFDHRRRREGEPGSTGSEAMSVILSEVKRLADPYRDLAVIDTRAPRFNQATIGLLSALGVATGWWWLLAVLAVQ